MIARTISRLLDPRPLSPAAVRTTLDQLVSPVSTDAERAAVLVALAARKDRPVELARFALDLRRRARLFPLPPRSPAIDLCGSGGAPHPSFNVSTVSAFVVAAAGGTVVKHGNRSARGPCGSSDLLTALGLPVTTSLAFARSSLRAHRLAFLHAPLYHPATAAVAGARKLIGIPTIFNRLGPLSNPARVPYQVAGAPSEEIARSFATVFPALGVRRGVAMSSAERSDEFSPRRTTSIFVWDGTSTSTRTIDPAELLEPEERRGGWGPLPPERAAAETERLLAGGGGARRGSVLLTSGAALWVSRTCPSLAGGVERAREVLASGEATALLDSMRTLGRKFRGGSA